MDHIEYEITFISFFIGLGVADLFSSLIRMLKKREIIRWHWLPLFWALIAFMGLITAWFAYAGIVEQEATSSALGFIFAISPAIFIFAFTVSILPHEIPPEGLDLKEYYFKNQKLIFSLLSLDFFTRFLTWYFLISTGSEYVMIIGILLILQLLIIGLTFIKNKYYHISISILLFMFNLLNLMGQSLTAPA